MKTMKNHLILLLVVGLFSLTSCSNDDDGTTEVRTVVDTWTLVSMNPAAFNLEECPDKPLITFHEDGNAEWTFYSQDNNCQGSTDTGTWQQNSDTEYTINVPNFAELTGTVTFSSASRFTFTSTYQNVPFTLTFEK